MQWSEYYEKYDGGRKAPNTADWDHRTQMKKTILTWIMWNRPGKKDLDFWVQ